MATQSLKKPTGSNPVGIFPNLKRLFVSALIGLWIEFCNKPSFTGGFCVLGGAGVGSGLAL